MFPVVYDTSSFIYVLGYSKYQGRGVMKENGNCSVQVIYYEKKTRGFGVRKDNLIFYQIQDRRMMLMYDKPCVCGSLTHRTTRDSRCVMNDQYIDAIE